MPRSIPVALAIALLAAPAWASTSDTGGPGSLLSLAAADPGPAAAPAPTDAAPKHGSGDASPWSITLHVENDSRPLQPFIDIDRHYTHAMKLVFAHQPQWAADLAAHMPFREAYAGGRTAAGYVLGYAMHTPDDITRAIPDPQDRPFAGWLYGGAFWQRDTGKAGFDNVAMLDHVEINMGMVGPSSQMAGLQRWWHNDVVDAREPRGWGSQLHDEFAFDLVYQHFWRLPLFEAGVIQGQVIPRAGFTLGTLHRQVNADATLRIGCHLPDDFGPGRIDQPAAATGLAERAALPSCLSAYGFLRAGGRAVEHNLFIEGNTLGQSPGIDERPLVGELQFGLALEILRHLEVSWSLTYLSEETYHQRGADSFGALTCAAHFDF